MAKEIYDKLVEALLQRGGAIPPEKCKEFFLLAEELFTEEEAELAIRMPLTPVTAEKMAEETAQDLNKVTTLLEEMADKGFLFCKTRKGTRLYNLMQLVPGISEYQFMRGTSTDRDKKLARLFEDFHNVTWGNPDANKSRPTVPFARVLVVEKEMPHGVAVHPYDKVSEYIEQSKSISVSQCFCRHQAELLEEPCDKPKETCFCFGPTAEFVMERGFGRRIAKEEALEILDRCEDAGLVHCSSNVSDRIDFLCNCCICHCGIIQTLKDTRKISFGATSNYLVAVDSAECTGCGDCLEICPLDILSLQGDVVDRDAGMCIGCGLCVSRCPSEALSMVPREEVITPPESFRDLMTAMAASIPPKE